MFIITYLDFEFAKVRFSDLATKMMNLKLH